MGSPFGLKGFVKIKSFSGEISHFSRLKKVTLKQGSTEQSWDIAETLSQGDTMLIRFAGVDSPEAAGALKGAQIIAGREFAAPLKEGEFYVEDLKEIDVLNKEGSVLGHIINVMEGGGGDLVELKLLSGLVRIVPFRNEFFGDVNLKEGKIVLLETWILE